MTDTEWPLFAAEVEATFRGDLAEDREAALRTHFGAVPFDWARRCLRRLVLDGQVWTPTPGELVKTLERIVPGNGWEFRRLLAGRTEAEQRAVDHLEVCGRLGVEPDPDIVAPLQPRAQLEAAS